MSHPVIIFSADKLRGGIIKDILQRGGIKAGWTRGILETRDAISELTPAAVIVDTKSSLASEIDFLKNLFGTLQDSMVIVLGNPSITGTFEGPGIREELRLSDPLDPDLIVAKVNQILRLRKKNKHLNESGLANNLKQFLKLD